MLALRLVTAIFTVGVALLACGSAHAGAPTERLREFFSKVNGVLVDPATAEQPLERVARIRRLVTDVSDMNAASAYALGAEWQKRTSAERAEFVGLFADLLERAYVGRLAGAVRVTGSVTMTYLGETPVANDVAVHTALRGLGGRDMRVDFVMIARGGKWRVRDIVVDGVSTVENYHAQFRRLLGQDSYAALVQGLRAKLAEESLMFTALERKPEAPSVRIVESDLTTPPLDDAPLPRRTREVRPPAPASAPTPAVKRVEPPAPPKAKPIMATVSAPVIPAVAPMEPPVVVQTTLPRETVAVEPPARETSAGEALVGALALGVLAMGGALLLRRRSAR